jgi:hypothetical protein
VSHREVEQRRAVADALAACAAAIEVGASGWRLSPRLDAAPAVPVEARLDDGWLHLSAPLPLDLPATPVELLRRNAELAGGVKLAWSGAPQLRAELPLDDEPSLLRRRIVAACAGFASAAAGRGRVPDGPAGELSDPGALLAESGWKACERRDGSWTVDLGVPDAFFQAEIDTCDGATRFAVALATADDAPGVCRQAQALLLLRAAAVVRMARPVRAGDTDAPHFEVALAGATSAAEVGHALSALAVACRLFGREVDIVGRDTAIATHYCARQPPMAARHAHNQAEGKTWDRQQQ